MKRKRAVKQPHRHAWDVFRDDVRKADDPVLTAVFRAAWRAVKIANGMQRQHDFKNLVIAAVSEAYVDIAEAKVNPTPKEATKFARTAAARLAKRETRLPHQAYPNTDKSIRAESESNGNGGHADSTDDGEGSMPDGRAVWSQAFEEENAIIAAIDQTTRTRLIAVIGEAELDWLLDYELEDDGQPKSGRDRVHAMRLKNKIARSELAGDNPVKQSPVAVEPREADPPTQIAA